MAIPSTFWLDVEHPLKYVLYGDSVAAYSKIIISIDKEVYYLTVEEAWNLLLLNEYLCEIRDDHEYIFIKDNVTILTYDIKHDSIYRATPNYIMRHRFKGDLIRLNFTNMANIDITKNHSLITYKNFELHKILPKDANYVAVCKHNLDTSNFEYDLEFFLYGLWLSNGSLTYKQNNPYPAFSFGEKDLTINLIQKIDKNNNINNIYHKNEWDFYINYNKFTQFLINHNYDRLNSPDRLININIKSILKNDLNSFISFFIGYYIGDGSFTTNIITFTTASLQLAEDIIELLMHYGIYSHLVRDKNGRSYKGKIKGDMFAIKVLGIPIQLLNLLKSVEYLKKHELIEEHGLHFGFGNSPLNNGIIVRSINKRHVQNIKPVKIISKENIEYDNYVYDFEVPNTHNFIINGVLVHNTDSLYINIDKEYDTIEETIKDTTKIAEDINAVIKNYFDSYLLPKLGVNPIYNKTFFKTELTAESIIFLETKKNYAYNMTSKEGKIYNPPETNYTGISVVKSDTAPLTKDLIKELVEHIALNKNIRSKNEVTLELNNCWNKYWETLKECIRNLDFEYIATPCKWSNTEYDREPAAIIAMRVYNTITDTETFKENTYGFKIPIKINNIINFNNSILSIKNKSPFYINNITVDKINYIAIPYDFDKDVLSAQLNKYFIVIDPNDVWNKLTNVVTHRIIETIKQTYGILT